MVKSSTVQQFINLNEMDNVQLDNEKTIIYQPYEMEQILLAENASCLAVKTYFKMLKIDYEVRTVANAEFISSTGKQTHLPVVKIGEFVASELEPVINLMEHKHISLTEKLDQDEKEELITYMSLVDSILTNAEQYISWVDDKVRNEITYKRNGSVYPFPLNHIQNWRKRWAVMKKLRFYEWDKYTMEEVTEKVDKLCETLSQKLGNQGLFFKIPTELDALVFGHLFCIFTMKMPTTFTETINKYENLINFCKRIESLYFGKIDA